MMITCKKTDSQIESDATATIIGSSLEDIPDTTKDDSCKSEGSVSTLLIPSGGIDIVDKTEQQEDDHPQGDREEEKVIPEGEEIEEEKIVSSSEAQHDDIIKEDEGLNEQKQEEEFHGESREKSLEPSEPGYALDDDGQPGFHLTPLVQDVALHPSQELDPVQRGEVYKYHKSLEIDHFLTAFVILALALVIGLGIGHFLGLFFSVMTSIHSSLFGLAPDPFEQSLEMGLDQGMVDSVGGLHGKYSQHNIEKDNPTVGELENNHWNQQSGDDNIDVNGKLKQDPMGQAESFSILGAIKNVFTRLGTKLGYIRKSVNSKSDVNATTAEEYYEFQCMTADDQPILVSGQPVMVRDPHSCQQYYSEGQGAGYASVTEPPAVFMELARGTFKSDVQDLDDRVIRQLWDENQELRDQVNQMRTNVGDQGDEAMAAILRDRINKLLTANTDLEQEVARLRSTDAESVETLDKLRKTRDSLNVIGQLKIEDDLNYDKDHDDDEDDEDDDEIKNKSMYNLSKYLSGLVKVGSKILTKQRTIDWVQAKRFVSDLREVFSAKLGEAGVLAK